MVLPMWTDGCVDSMEGLLFESASTTPYHFLNQAELSVAPSEAMAEPDGLDYGGLDVPLGIQHLQLLGVKYFMASSSGGRTGRKRRSGARADRDERSLAHALPGLRHRHDLGHLPGPELADRHALDQAAGGAERRRQLAGAMAPRVDEVVRDSVGLVDSR